MDRSTDHARSLRLILLAAAAAVSTGCAELPQFGASPTPAAAGPLPKIKPLNEVLAAGGDSVLQPTDAVALQTRAAALQGRAGTIAATGTDAATLERLEAAIAAKKG